MGPARPGPLLRGGLGPGGGGGEGEFLGEPSSGSQDLVLEEAESAVPSPPVAGGWGNPKLNIFNISYDYLRQFKKSYE